MSSFILIGFSGALDVGTSPSVGWGSFGGDGLASLRLLDPGSLTDGGGYFGRNGAISAGSAGGDGIGFDESSLKSVRSTGFIGLQKNLNSVDKRAISKQIDIRKELWSSLD